MFTSRLDFRPELGIYDLLISNSTYERDNGKFECRLKAAGTGREIHSQSFQITVLTPPSPPRITPGPNPVATEGRPLELSCGSAGGSPDPIVRWYREGVPDPIDSVTRISNVNKETVTSAVLQVTPSREDDGAVYRCVVWNRAMVEGIKFETRTTLSVNCEYRRITCDIGCIMVVLKLKQIGGRLSGRSNSTWLIPVL